MKFKITLNGRNYEIEVETIEPMTLTEYEAEAPEMEFEIQVFDYDVIPK